MNTNLKLTQTSKKDKPNLALDSSDENPAKFVTDDRPDPAVLKHEQRLAELGKLFFRAMERRAAKNNNKK